MLTALTFAAGALAAQQPPRPPLEPCTIPSPMALVTSCATIQVPENRSIPSGRSLGIRVVVVQPDSGAELPDPIVPVPGGPGQAAIPGMTGWARLLRGVRGHRAVVLVDPRGTGESEALDCDFTDGPDHPGSYVRDFAPVAKLRSCAANLSKVADLTQYNTDAIARDLAEVLTALGYERANFFGVSGGTRQSLVFANLYPARVRTLILGGMVAPAFRVPIAYAKDFDRSLALLFADCARDAGCHAAFPDPKGDLDRVLAELDRAPAVVSLPIPGRPGQTARVTRGIFADRIRTMLYVETQAATVPFVLHRAAAGDFLPFVTPLVPGLGLSGSGNGIAMGHYLSVTCSDDVDRIRQAERTAAAEGTALGDYRVQQQVDACALWPHARLPESHFAYRKLEIPALLISGDADPVTPPRWADSTLQYLSQARSAVFPTGGHVPVGTACAAALETQLILSGSSKGLDVGCAKTMTRPPFKLQ